MWDWKETWQLSMGPLPTKFDACFNLKVFDLSNNGVLFVHQPNQSED